MRLIARRAKHRTAPRSRSSSPFDKNIPLRVDPKSDLQLGCPPHRGELAIVVNVGMGCGGRGSVEHEVESQGGFSRERWQHADERRWSVQQNRVVLAPVAGVKSAEFWLARPGLAKHQFADDGGKNEFVSGESAA